MASWIFVSSEMQTQLHQIYLTYILALFSFTGVFPFQIQADVSDSLRRFIILACVTAGSKLTDFIGLGIVGVLGIFFRIPLSHSVAKALRWQTTTILHEFEEALLSQCKNCIRWFETMRQNVIKPKKTFQAAWQQVLTEVVCYVLLIIKWWATRFLKVMLLLGEIKLFTELAKALKLACVLVTLENKELALYMVVNNRVKPVSFFSFICM